MQGHKLEELLKSSDQISQVLDYLKHRLSRQEQQIGNFSQDAVDLIQKAIDLKMSFRLLAEGIEINRTLVQVQKQQIQKKRAFLDGLQYYKATLKTQIGHSKLDSIDMKDYIQEEPSPDIDWMQDYERQEQKVLDKLEQFKDKKQTYDKNQLRRQQLTKLIQVSQQKYKKTLPQQIKKLCNQVSETSKIFDMQVGALQLWEFKSRKIQLIHSLLYPLQLKGFIDIKHSNESDTEQLQITVEKGFYPQYQYARLNKVKIQEKQFKFSIASLPRQGEHGNQQVLAVSIPMGQDFTTEQIFNNLFLQEKVRWVYLNPKSQLERQTNSKYSQLDWIGQILTSNLVNGNQFIQRVKDRVFSLTLIRHALENISKNFPPYYFPLFKPTQKGSNSTQSAPLQLEKVLMIKCQRTTFQQYKTQIYIPQWAVKALNNYQRLREQQNYSKDNSSLESYNFVDRCPLNAFVEKNYLEELQTKGFYSYFHFQILVFKGVLTGFFLIPNDYPNRPSIVRLISYTKYNQTSQDISMPKQIHLTIQTHGLEIKDQLFSEQLAYLQSQLNQKIDYFLQKSDKSGFSSSQKCKKKQPFLIYFQINRLFSLLIEQSIQNQTE